MDITFHYFAVKTLAKKAGFGEEEAQRIATYSEYIDDFNWITYLDCKNLPDYIKNDASYDLYVPSWLAINKNFNPATTGFIGIVDMATLLLERTQKFTVSPFHFIPPSIGEISKDTRTVPAVVGNGSLISSQVIKAREAVRTSSDRQMALMQLGMVLHTFADTYAHQMFSGYNSWVNDVKVEGVVDNASNTDMTKAVLQEINRERERVENEIQETNAILPCIGHMWAYHTPDLTNTSFELRYKANKNDSAYSKTYVRSNTETFVTAAKHILNLLLSCLNKEPITEGEWAPFAERLAQAFLFEFPTKAVEKTLADHWHAVFPEYDYSYSKKSVEATFYEKEQEGNEENSILGTNYTQEFYQYNCIADALLIEMYGAKPRSAWWN